MTSAQREKAKLQWLQNLHQTSTDSMNKVTHKTKTFRNKKREYLKEKIHKLETISNGKWIRDLYRGINEFKKGYNLDLT
jgi:hypothetical protein